MKPRGYEKSNRMQREQGDINTTANREKYWQRNLSGRARKIFEEDNKYFLHQSLSTPALNVLSRAQGIHIEDLDGNRYIDMHGNGVHNAGFNNPEVIEAVKKQLNEELAFCSRRYTNIPAVRLAKKLAEITPGNLCRSLFCPGGSEAIEMAIMLARLVTGNYKTISFWDSYHGTGFGAAGISGEELFHGGLGPMLPGAFHVEFPNYYRNPWGFTDPEDVDDESIRQMELILMREPEMAAVIAEPISAKPVIPSKRYWEKVKKLCDRYGALLIFDEIIEGFGRTGKMFASEHYLVPDILVLGKSLGGGVLPFAGIVSKDSYNTCMDRAIGHYTHEKNPLCASAALAEIAYIEKHKLYERAARIGGYALERLNEMKPKYRLIGEVKGIGLHLGIDLVKDQTTKKRAVDEAEIIMYKCMEKGLAFKVIEGNVITLRPALTIAQKEMDRAIDILDDAIGEVEAGIKY